MSIDIRCYSAMDLGDLRAKLDCLMQKYSYIFNDVYHIFEPEGVLSHQDINAIDERVEKYNSESTLLIAEEFGMMNTKSCFSIRVMYKTFSVLDTPELVDLLRKELSDGQGKIT
ncbi:hypothetical protein [Escherichia fergusonii]|uniref:hypothetical protein n=1 Tax=Escherichia fergusonii TaxID=564 RepID=UPI0015E4E4E6|nr:hypothetical protein [Escherichia fergusonii]EHG6156600.1 hypothetical protein [Escherichia fergusonii]QLM89572.1 hypothetical protein HVX34_02255 [Escherichia fergusonii]QMH66984.1 hypothetical protein HVY27_02495 [Escherichia fergusonii]QML46176.1 hypothetical protein HVX35_02255 [Escherichia fergusonii]QMS06078.1 hypothetical protein HVX36_13400 [Escherichia fergusonii]